MYFILTFTYLHIEVCRKKAQCIQWIKFVINLIHSSEQNPKMSDKLSVYKATLEQELCTFFFSHTVVKSWSIHSNIAFVT